MIYTLTFSCRDGISVESSWQVPIMLEAQLGNIDAKEVVRWLHLGLHTNHMGSTPDLKIALQISCYTEYLFCALFKLFLSQSSTLDRVP